MDQWRIGINESNNGAIMRKWHQLARQWHHQLINNGVMA